MTSPRPRRWPALSSLALAAAALTLPGAAPAGALSCVEPAMVAAEQPHLFTGRVLSVEGDRYLVEVEAQRPGEAVPFRVTLTVGLRGWDAWTMVEGTDEWLDSDYAETIFLVSADARWRTDVCAMWPVDPAEVDEEWLGPVLDQVTSPVPTPMAPMTAGPDRLPPAPLSLTAKAVAGGSGVGAGLLVLALAGLRGRSRCTAARTDQT